MLDYNKNYAKLSIMSDNNNQKTDWQKREIGALWKRESATQKYFSGHVTVDDFGVEKKLKVLIFTNKSKDKDNQPDFRVYKADDPTAPKVVSDDSVEEEVHTSEEQEVVVDDVL